MLGSLTRLSAVLLYFVVLISIGVLASRRMNNVRDYFAAGKSLSFWVAAFSARATGESAWLLLGFTGMGAAVGIQAFWVVLGEIIGVNTPALEGVASVDLEGTIFFVSTRSYESSLSTIYRGRFDEGKVSDVELVPGVSRLELGIVNFDAEISPDGTILYFVDGRFSGSSFPDSADLVMAVRSGSMG